MVRLLLLLLFAFSSATTTAKERITYFHNDLLGSPVAATNAQGDVLWQEEYTAYGKRLLKADQGRNSRWFTGKSEAAALSVQYFDARWYDADLGRFLSVDPVDFQEGDVHSFNRYAYANNNPYRYVDPNGESPLDVGFLVVDVVKLGVAVYSGVGVGAAAVDVGFSVIGVLSPVPGMGVLSKSAYLAKAVKASKTVDKAADVANSAGKSVKEGIYEFTDTAGKKYCGQSCNIPQRLDQHVKSGKLDPAQSVATTEVLGGKTAREIAEHKRIQEITGGVPARFSDKVSNKVDPIGPNRSHLLNE